MKRLPFILLLLAFLCSNLCVKAQDTTLLRLRKMTDDTIKVNNFLAYGKSYQRTEPEKAIVIYNESLEIAKKIKDENSIARAMLGLGFVNLSTGKYQAAIQQYQSAAHIFQKLGNT